MELFLVLPVLILVVVAALQVIGVARARIEIQGAAREGARVAATTPDPARGVEAVLAALPPGLRDLARISVERPARVGAVTTVAVSMRYPLGKPFSAEMAVHLTARATMRTER